MATFEYEEPKDPEDMIVDELILRIKQLEHALAPVAGNAETWDRIRGNLIESGTPEDKIAKIGCGLWCMTSMGMVYTGTDVCERARDLYGRKRTADEFNERLRLHNEQVAGQAAKEKALASGTKLQ